MVEALKIRDLVEVFCAHGRQSHQTEAGGGEVIALRHGAMRRRRAAVIAHVQGFSLGFPMGGLGQAAGAPAFLGRVTKRVHELSQSGSQLCRSNGLLPKLLDLPPWRLTARFTAFAEKSL